jgi:DNA-binding MarR family transcriptional regulator
LGCGWEEVELIIAKTIDRKKAGSYTYINSEIDSCLVISKESGDFMEEDIFSQLSNGMKLLYNFASLINIHVQHKNCSTIEPDMTMTEVHTLIDILENPGLTSSELGKMNNKTRGAVCQIIGKLEKSECIIKQQSSTNGKKIQLFLTDKGKMIAEEHLTYDIKALTGTLNKLLAECSVDEINSFYKVLGIYNEILRDS